MKSAWVSARDKESTNEGADLDTLPVGEDYWEATNPTPNLHVSMDPEFLNEWVADYESDQSFGGIWANKARLTENWKGNGRFLRDERGLLFFLDENYQPRLCVPKTRRNFLLKEAHESPFESAHVAPNVCGRISARNSIGNG